METTIADAPETVPTEPSRGTSIATLGLLMAAAGPILLLIATLAFGLSTDDAAFFVLPAVLGLVGAWLVRRSATGAKVGAIVLAVLILAAVFWTAFGLALPASFFDFVPGTLVVPGVLLAIGGSIASIRSRKRGRRVEAGERKAVWAIVGLIGILAVVSAVLTVTGRDTVPDALAEQADLSVDMEDFDFDAESYEANPGDTVLVQNDDPFTHTFTIDELGIDIELGPYSEELVELPDDSGTYVLYCEPHTSDPEEPSDDDMAAELTVTTSVR
jgi:plastocyanin